MAERLWLLGAAGAVLLAGCTADSPLPRPFVSVDLGDRYQEIEGFGVSGCWWAQDVGGWRDENRRRIVQLLFDRTGGIGLSMYRYNIGAGSGHNIADPWRRTETFEVGPGQYDWTRDRNAVWVLKAARDAGVGKFIAFANSPPARMTRTGYVSGGPHGESNLREDMYGEFAQYLVDVVRHLREDEDVPIGWISPINEPQWAWKNANGQEGCHYTTDELVAFLEVLLQHIYDSGLDVRISAVEAGEWATASIYLDRLLDSPRLREALDHFAVHSYWSKPEDKRRFVAYLRTQAPQMRLWMSEWTEMEQGYDPGIDAALVLANTVHDDLTIGSVTSWQYWTAVSKYDYHDGLIYTEEWTQSIEETKRLWSLGNYSRFVRPGDVRVGAEAVGTALKVSAYTEPAGRRLVVVAINNAPDPVEAGLGLTGWPPGSALAAYETSAAANLAQVYTGPPLAAYVFAPRSVTTLVLSR